MKDLKLFLMAVIVLTFTQACEDNRDASHMYVLSGIVPNWNHYYFAQIFDAGTEFTIDAVAYNVNYGPNVNVASAPFPASGKFSLSIPDNIRANPDIFHTAPRSFFGANVPEGVVFSNPQARIAWITLYITRTGFPNPDHVQILKKGTSSGPVDMYFSDSDCTILGGYEDNAGFWQEYGIVLKPGLNWVYDHSSISSADVKLNAIVTYPPWAEWESKQSKNL